SAFYNVSAIERDYFELWYFTNPGAYKGMAHGANELSQRFHDRMAEEIQAIEATAAALRERKRPAGETLKRLWMEGEYTEFNRDHN
ncbi:MAG: hydroxylamine oxidoreductase, partial [Magnetococcales bacterium]|nr:hydroxylamine oxidoreductase [Magnetococcales bacterium]